MLSIVSGVAGFGFLLAGYMLSLFGKLDQDTVAFNLINFIGAVLLVYYTSKAGFLSITVLPGIWAVVALFYMLVHHKANRNGKMVFEARSKRNKKGRAGG